MSEHRGHAQVLLGNERGEVIPGATLRTDAWWVEPLLVVARAGRLRRLRDVGGAQNAHYFAAPYLSPFYSPCLATNCQHVTPARWSAPWWNPVAGVPDPVDPRRLPGRPATTIGRPTTARSSARRRPAPCATGPGGYTGETRFPFVLQNIHRYFFWLSLPVVAFLWWDAILAFRFPGASASGLGTLVLMVNAALLSLLHVLVPLLPAPLRRASSTCSRARPGKYSLWRASRGSTSGTCCSPGSASSGWA